jgi:N-acyl-D-amino-acid deacylase
MRLGATRENQRAADEVRYYTPNNESSRSVFAGYRFQPPSTFTLNQVYAPKPYGAFYLEAGDAAGGWIASVIDLARFAAAFDNLRQAPLLTAETLRIMHAPPSPPVFRTATGLIENHYYGCGWWIGKSSNVPTTYWHNGYFPGSSTLLVRRDDGLAWVLLFNQDSTSPIVENGMEGLLHNAAAAVTDWPAEDQFSSWRGPGH